MRITSSSVQLASTHVEQQVSTSQERLQLWVGDGPAPTSARAPTPTPASTPTAISTAISTQAPGQDPTGSSPVDDAKGSTRDQLDLAILRRVFRLGRRLTRGATDVINAYRDGAQAGQATASDLRAHAGPAPAAEAPPRQGWGLSYDRTDTTLAVERTTFAAQAHVQTADGRTLDVAAALTMERAEATTSEVHLRAGDAAKVDPLVLNLQGGAATFDGTTSFDVNADGQSETVARLAPGSAYLALDRNGNGTIDSGAELLGPSTGSGFGELSALDADQNGWVDEGDAAFSRLSLWNPTTGALTSLMAADVGAISTASAATAFDVKQGGALQASVARTGLYLRESDGGAGTVQHVDLVA